MNEKDRLAGFKALVEDHKNSSSHFEEMDGSHRLWHELSPQSKLQYLARDAVWYDVPFERFAEAVRESVDKHAIEEAALRLVLRNERELHEMEKLFPDDGRTEPTPLIERVSELLNEDAVYSKTEFERLLVEQRDDAAQRPLHEKGVRYEDEPNSLREILDGKSPGREINNGVDEPEQGIER